MSFHQKAVEIIKQIPYGHVATYGQIAFLAGNPSASRQVARTLHTSSEKEGLPWHRVINKYGMISLRPGNGFEIQKSRLESEGIIFGGNNAVDLEQYLWDGR